MRMVCTLLLSGMVAAPAFSATRLEVQYDACLKATILKHRAIERLLPEDEVKMAADACAEIAPEFAEDIRMNLLECGVEPSDSSPDMGCESDVVARPPVESPDAAQTKQSN